MSILWELLRLDFLATKAWFGQQTVSKIIVACLYLLVLVGVGFGIYFWSGSFFRYLLVYESFGQQTATYILRSATVVFTWIGLLSTLISTLTFLLTADKNTDLLVTLPIPGYLISLRSTLRSLFINFVLFSVSIFPLILSFYLTQSGFGFWKALGSSLSLLILILLISQFVGSALGYVLAFSLRKKYGRFIALLSGLTLVLATWLLLRQVFPPELRQLSDVPAEEYPAIFNRLPLMKSFWPAGWSLPLAALFIFLLSSVSFLIQKNLFISCWQAARVHFSTLRPTKALSFRLVGLAAKDILSIVRSPKDLGYLLFLLSMIVAFFGLFSRGYLVNSIPERFRVDALAFSFAWLTFFSGTYLIRLVYPLMVNEGQSRWWFFTLPVFPYRLLLDKVAVSLLASFPLILITLLEWNLVPFALSVPFLLLLSLEAILLLATLFPLLGALYPEYTLAYDPDKSSTSFTGLVAIIIVCLIGALGSWLISQSLRFGLPPAIAVNGLLTAGLLLIGLVGVLALSHTAGHTMEL